MIVKRDGLPGSEAEGCQSWKVDDSFETGNQFKFNFPAGLADDARICDDRGNAYWIRASESPIPSRVTYRQTDRFLAAHRRAVLLLRDGL